MRWMPRKPRTSRVVLAILLLGLVTCVIEAPPPPPGEEEPPGPDEEMDGEGGVGEGDGGVGECEPRVSLAEEPMQIWLKVEGLELDGEERVLVLASQRPDDVEDASEEPIHLLAPRQAELVVTYQATHPGCVRELRATATFTTLERPEIVAGTRVPARAHGDDAFEDSHFRGLPFQAARAHRTERSLWEDLELGGGDELRLVTISASARGWLEEATAETPPLTLETGFVELDVELSLGLLLETIFDRGGFGPEDQERLRAFIPEIVDDLEHGNPGGAIDDLEAFARAVRDIVGDPQLAGDQIVRLLSQAERIRDYIEDHRP